MTPLMRYFVVVCLLGSSFLVSAQGYNIGIRAGLGQTTFNAPTEEGESYGLTGGFHFGLNFQWNFNETFGVRSEILYNQMGSSYKLDKGDGFYVFTPNDNLGKIVLRDSSLITLDHSNAYLQLPQTFHIRLNKKFEIFGGGYVGFLLSPVATGNIRFGGSVASKEHSFLQGLNFNYSSDDANTRTSRFNTPTGAILIRAEGRDVDLRRVENSYDFLGYNIEQSKFLSIDLGLSFGASYYINRGLYIMGRVEYGMRDITRNATDYSLGTVTDTGSPVYNNDVDKNVGYYLSLGFRF